MNKLCLYIALCLIAGYGTIINGAFAEAASAEAAEFPTVALEASPSSRQARVNRETTSTLTQSAPLTPSTSSAATQAIVSAPLTPSTTSQSSSLGEDTPISDQSPLEPVSNAQPCPPFPCQGNPTCSSCPPGQTCACAAHSGKWVCCDSATICGNICQIEDQQSYDLVQGLHFLIDVQPPKCGYQWDDPTVDNQAVLHQFKVRASELGSKIPLTPGATARFGFPSMTTGTATITQNQRDTRNNCVVFTKKHQINVIPAQTASSAS